MGHRKPLLWIGWLVAIGRLDQPRLHPTRPAGPTTISVPAIRVQATTVVVGLQANGAIADIPETYGLT